MPESLPCLYLLLPAKLLGPWEEDILHFFNRLVKRQPFMTGWQCRLYKFVSVLDEKGICNWALQKLPVGDYSLGDHICGKQFILHTEEFLGVHEVQDITRTIFTSPFGCFSFLDSFRFPRIIVSNELTNHTSVVQTGLCMGLMTHGYVSSRLF